MLISATHPLPSNPLESFEYDKVGNRTNAGSYTYDSCNRLLEDNEFTYTYDNNGNMITKTKKSTNEVTTYTYNAENQLVRVSFPEGGFVSYRYDGLGRRIEKNHNGNITQYYYDNEDILLEYIYQPSTNNYQLSSRYTHGPGIDEPLIMDRDGENYYHHTDGLGSITAITDSSQDIINSYTYDSFGSIIESSGSLANPYTYTARELDPETGLYYYRARYYDPKIGRFLQEDPYTWMPDDERIQRQERDIISLMLEFSGISVRATFRNNRLAEPIIAIGDTTFDSIIISRSGILNNKEVVRRLIVAYGQINPLTTNRYSYCYNNPTNLIDPGGKYIYTIGIGWKIASWIVIGVTIINEILKFKNTEESRPETPGPAQEPYRFPPPQRWHPPGR